MSNLVRVSGCEHGRPSVGPSCVSLTWWALELGGLSAGKVPQKPSHPAFTFYRWGN